MSDRKVVLLAIGGMVLAAALIAGADAAGSDANKKETTVTKFVRFQADKTVAYGIVEGDKVRQLDGDLFGQWKKTERTYPIDQVKLLVPTTPGKVLALAGNYRSHLGSTQEPGEPQPFFKVPGCLIADGEPVVIPKGTKSVHFEAELVVVIGKRAKNISEEQAPDYILGITCGNDVSARDWQSNDRQWWRAKGSDTFGPVGPYIVSGLNYGDLLIEGRLNGEVKQHQRTKDFIHDIPTTVSFISQFVTLEPGDLIFTGTPGKTAEIKAGDVVEIELEGVGVLTNPITAEQ